MSHHPVAGFRFSGIHCGIKSNGKPDLGMIVADAPVACAGVYTTNQVVAAPVVLSQSHLRDHQQAQVVVINSGNANACTGAVGDTDALRMAQETAELVECDIRDVQVCSTGVIGAPLPMDAVSQGIKDAHEAVHSDRLDAFGDAICTTDTFRKMRSARLSIGNRTIHIAGVSKGAGMIHPNMATMLGVVVTDAPIAAPTLNEMWATICGQTFNAITVDGDTSTNDTALIMASGKAGGAALTGEELAEFEQALLSLTTELAKDIVRDAEGGTKVIEICVSRAPSTTDARQVAETIALSPLVKTAFHGEDPNWGRIIAATGRSGVSINPEKLSLSIGGHDIYRNGRWLGSEAEARAHQVMKTDEYGLIVDLGIGQDSHKIYTCDLSAEYVAINADYRS